MSSNQAKLAAMRHDPNQNHVLAALLDAEFDRLSPHLDLLPMPLGDVLYESGSKMHHVYFPTTAIISLHYLLENGGSSEIAGVGNEGVVGLAAALNPAGGATEARFTSSTGKTMGFESVAGLLLVS